MLGEGDGDGLGLGDIDELALGEGLTEGLREGDGDGLGLKDTDGLTLGDGDGLIEMLEGRVLLGTLETELLEKLEGMLLNENEEP